MNGYGSKKGRIRNKKRAHGGSNPRDTRGSGSKVGNPGSSMRVKGKHGGSHTVSRRAHRGR